MAVRRRPQFTWSFACDSKWTCVEKSRKVEKLVERWREIWPKKASKKASKPAKRK